MTDEGKRYSKAYGQGALDFEQFKDLIRETTKKKKAFYEQLGALNTKIAQEGIDKNQLELIIEEAKRLIRAQNFSNKIQVVRDIITKVILKGVDKVIVRGRLPLFALNMGYGSKSRDCWVA